MNKSVKCKNEEIKNCDCANLVKEFINDELNGEIFDLASYDFSKLEGDLKFGNQRGYFDCDDTLLARAIYCVLWKEIDCVSKLIKDGKYRGDTLNSFNTVFGKNRDKAKKISDEIMNLPERDMFRDKVKDFSKRYHTIGNFVILPNKLIKDIVLIVKEEGRYVNKLGSTTINRYRGLQSSGLHDYFDQFLSVLENWYNKSNEISNDWKKVLDGNKHLFLKKFDDFRDMFFLNPYFDDGRKNVRRLTENFPSAKGRPTLEKAEKYLKDATQIINQRAEIMIENLEGNLWKLESQTSFI